MNKINIDILEYPQLRLEMFSVSRLCPRTWDHISLDGHFWRFYHNSTGGAGVWIHGKKMELRPDRVYLIPPNSNLQTWCSGNPVQLFLHFEVSSMGGNSAYPCNEVELTEDMKKNIEAIRELLSTEKTSARLHLQMVALASNTMALLPDEALNEYDPDPRISRVCIRIREDLSEDFSLDRLARWAGMASNSFLRRFREVTGTTPHQYILNLRYALAARLLENKQSDIAEVCERIGVKDRFHFSRQFKALYGMAPGEYRKNRTSPA